jgi:hypothetical protein
MDQQLAVGESMLRNSLSTEASSITGATPPHQGGPASGYGEWESESEGEEEEEDEEEEEGYLDYATVLS